MSANRSAIGRGWAPPAEKSGVQINRTHCRTSTLSRERHALIQGAPGTSLTPALVLARSEWTEREGRGDASPSFITLYIAPYMPRNITHSLPRDHRARTCRRVRRTDKLTERTRRRRSRARRCRKPAALGALSSRLRGVNKNGIAHSHSLAHSFSLSLSRSRSFSLRERQHTSPTGTPPGLREISPFVYRVRTLVHAVRSPLAFLLTRSPLPRGRRRRERCTKSDAERHTAPRPVPSPRAHSPAL